MNTHRSFWRSCRDLFRFKRRLVLALTGAVINAACFGAGIGMILPASYLVLQQGKGLKEMVREELVTSSHAAGRWLGGVLEPIAPADPYHGFLLIIAVSVAFSLVSMAGQLLHGLMVVRLLHRIARERQNAMFRHAVEVSVPTLWKKGAQEVISRMTGDLNVAMSGYSVVMGKGVQKVLMGVVALGMAFLLNWRLALFTLIAAPPVLAVMRWAGVRVRSRFNELQDQRSRMQGRLHESFGHFDVLKLYGAERFERRRFTRVTREVESKKRQMLDATVFAGPMIELLTVAGFGLVAAVAGWLVLRGNVEAMELLGVLALLGIVGRSVQVIVGMQNQINMADRALARVAEVFDLPVECEGEAGRPVLPRHGRSIRFEGVSYTYPGSSRPAVDGVTLEVPFGATVAVVGPNGSGKTTLLSLLARMMQPTAGRILIDGQDIAACRVRSLREQVAVVSQQPTVFSSSVRHNIAYGVPHVSMEDVVEAAKVARADGFIDALPDGYKTKIGPGGVRLSGGERQRVCLARAVLRKPAILILDEATSQIDGDSEVKINEAMAEMRRGRTTFVIAHRLTTVMSSDVIVVLDHGRVIDQGTHEALLDRCDVYRQHTRSQLGLMASEPAGV